MSCKYKVRQAEVGGKGRVRKQATFPEQSVRRTTPVLRRVATLPQPRIYHQLRLGATDGGDVTDGSTSVHSNVRRRRWKQQRLEPPRPVSDMSESGRSSPIDYESDSETDTGKEDDASIPSPETPQTADVNTDDKFNPYRFRVDDLTKQEKGWFEKIKKFKSVDETDEGSGAAHLDINRQISGVALAQYGNQPATTAFGKLLFEGENLLGVLPAWFVRIAVNTPVDLIQELLESKFEVMSSVSHPIRIHCIDYNMWPEGEVPPMFQFANSPVQPRKTGHWEAITLKLQRDLYSMCKKTAGIVLTWSGLAGNNIMHQVLGGIMEESRRTRRHAFNLASIATPPWNTVDYNLRLLMEKAKGEDVLVRDDGAYSPISPGAEEASGFTPERRSSMGSEISQYASHFMLLDDESASPGKFLSTDTEKSNFRHFHYDMINAMEHSEKKKKMQMPVVCVLMNGHHDALKMVVFALQKRIPVLIVKGSGGYADIIADVYFNAVLETTKEWDESGQVRTRNTKKPGDRGKFYMDHPKTRHPLLSEIFNNLDLLTVYVSTLSVQTLDSVIFEALLKHKQEAKFGGLVEVMQKSKKMLQHTISATEKSSFIDSDEVQMDYFIEALKQNSVDVVKIFLDQLNITDKFMQHFHMGRILRLYSKDASGQEKLIDFRRKFAERLKKLTVLPLRCVCDGCPNCDIETNTQSIVSELAVRRTCVHPIQELFLWAVHERHVEMAVVFWQKCEDKIAAALVARKVFRAMAKENSDPDIRWQMEQNIRQFEDLAIQTLRNCHNMDEIETELLLTKPCPWWGGMSVLQLAILTENREFITQTACRSIMTRVWYGKPLSDLEQPQKPCQLVDLPANTRCSGRSQKCSPFIQYIANFIMQIVFLGLFTYGLLSDIGHGLTIIFIVLIVWVAAITLEEIRQLVSKHSVLRDNSLERSGITSTKLQTYLSQGWNQIDTATIVLFWLGLVVLAPVPALRVIGRFLLSIDIFFFFMRTFQMLMVFEDLGLLLVMVYKMVKDTRNFMIILLIFVLAYAVTSESLLYPETDLTLPRIFHLPRKAYWQVFGELSLEEIEIREQDSCSVNKSKHDGYDEPPCPTNYGSYIVPVLLGIHVMITNVLLLNLLIARFGVTFSRVHDEAQEYQSWHRCQIITEYYNRTSFPPPFNILHVLLYLLVKGCIRIGRCLCWVCCCCRRRQGGRRQADAGNSLEMTAPGQGTRDGQNNHPLVAGEGNPLMANVSIKGWRSADRQSVDILWTSQLPFSSNQQSDQESDQQSDQESDQQTTQQVYNVEVAVSDHRQTPPPAQKFQVARKSGQGAVMKQAFTVWDLDPSATYHISVEGKPVDIKQVESSRDPEDLLETVEFENKQAQWVFRQQVSDMTWLNDLQDQTDTLKEEIGKMAGELKENHVTLKEDISKTDQKMAQNAKSLVKMTEYSKKSTGVYKKINTELEKLSNFLKEIVETVKGEAKKRKEAEEKRKAAENELHKAEKQITKLQLEKELAQSELRDLTKTLEEREQTLQRRLEAWKEEQQGMVQTVLQQQQTLQQELQQQQQDMQHQQQTQHEEQQKAVQQQLQTLQQEQQKAVQQQLQTLQQEQQQQLKVMHQQQSQMHQVLVQVMEAVQGGSAAPDSADTGEGQ